MQKISANLTAPQGFKAAGVKAMIKQSGNHDVGVVYCEVPAAVGAVFTQNKFAAPPVVISRQVASRDYVRAILVNSGCANACTGDQGILDARASVQMTANALDIDINEVLVCSTGVIGHMLPMGKLACGIKDAIGIINNPDTDKSQCGDEFTLAIQTTDTFEKKSAYTFTLNGKQVTIAGIAKGAGMIHPNMATMLTFITTDAKIEPKLLKQTVKHVADRSFNMVVVDGDTSTNDTMIVLASGLADNSCIDTTEHPDYPQFYRALLAVSQDLAKLIAKDGEGATKFLEVNIKEAASFEEAKMAAMAIAKSPLVKTAFFGKDANWGRIICAAGYSGANANPKEVTLYIEDVCIMAKGLGVEYDIAKLNAIMQKPQIAMTLHLACGTEQATVWTCDFSYDYVKINADYHT